MPLVISEVEDATLILRRPYPRMARLRRQALTTSVTHYQRRLHCKGRVSGRRSVLSCLKGWKLPLHLLHPTKLYGCIYIEKTPEQCYLGSHNSQKVWGNILWDKNSSSGLRDQQMEGQDQRKKAI